MRIQLKDGWINNCGTSFNNSLQSKVYKYYLDRSAYKNAPIGQYLSDAEIEKFLVIERIRLTEKGLKEVLDRGSISPGINRLDGFPRRIVEK